MTVDRIKTWVKNNRAKAAAAAAAVAVVALALYRRRSTTQQGLNVGFQPQQTGTAAADSGAYDQFTAALGQITEQQNQQAGIIYDALGQIAGRMQESQASIYEAMAQNAAYQQEATAGLFGSLFDSLDQIMAAQPTVPAAPRPAMAPGNTATNYVVGAGDTIASIAARAGLSISQLLAANPNSGSSFDAPGHRIYVPTAAAAPSPAAAATAPKPTVRHVFKEGENYATVAKQFGLTEAQLRAMNPKAGPQSGQAGTAIYIKGL